MISIIRFELLKIGKSKLFLLILFLWFTQIAGLHYIEVAELESPTNYSETYKRELNYYQTLEMDNIDSSIEERIKEADVVIAFDSVESLLYSEMLQTQQSLYPIQVEKYLSGELDLEFSEANILKKVLSKISEDKSHIRSFDDHVNQVIQQSQTMANISIFSQSKESSRNIEKTAEDYKTIQEVKAIWNDHLAFERFINNDYAYIFCLIALIFAVSSLTVTEKNEGVNTLINSTTLGGRKTILARECNINRVS